jgi:hypothetical protein
MFNKINFFLINSLLMMAIGTELPLLALPIPAFYQGMPYSEAREKMLDLGWQVPIVNYSCVDKVFKHICNQYPEVDDCSGTGMGFCLFNFTDSNGKVLTITTAGQDPLRVVNWRNQ